MNYTRAHCFHVHYLDYVYVIPQGYFSQEIAIKGYLGGSVVEHLPSAQGVILEFQNRIPHRDPCREPASPSAYVSVSLFLS